MILRHYLKQITHNQKGVALLFMVVLLATFLSISMGIVNILLGQLFIIGQASESFVAFYASDIGMERTLYRDRVQNACANADNSPTYACNESKVLSNGGCYQTQVDIPSTGCAAPDVRCMTIKGEDKCGSGLTRYVERQFEIKY